MSKKEVVVNPVVLTDDVLVSKIYEFRGQRVMLDRDLAEIYGVETRTLKQAVRRNIDRFPEDFMFELTDSEVESMVSQSVIPDKKIFGGASPFAFSELGVAMLSTVLKTKLAIQINIQIMRIFTRIRQVVLDNTEVKLEIAEIKYAVEQIAKKQKGHDQNIDLLFEYIDRLQEKQDMPQVARPELGFKIGKQG